MARSPRFGLDDTDPDALRLVSDDFDLYAPVFSEYELDGGGHDWESVAQYLANTSALDCADEIQFDSEASMFCAISHNRESLIELEEAMRITFRNRKRLSLAIQSAVEESGSTGSVFQHVVVLNFECYFEKYSELCDALEFDSDHEFLGAQGGGESTIWIRTNDVNRTIESCKSHLAQFKLLDTVTIGSRESSIDTYTVHWPSGYNKELKPFNEWTLDA